MTTSFTRRQTRSAASTVVEPTQTLYVLKCEDDCWYVGITGDMDQRWRQHSRGSGAEWTKEHHPIRIHSQRSVPYSQAKREEAILTATLMLKYGINRVRGAAMSYRRPYDSRQSDVRRVAGFIRKALDEDYYEILERVQEELDNDCAAAPDEDTVDEVGMLASVFGGLSFVTTPYRNTSTSTSTENCTRCGRNSHTRDKCYARTHIRAWKL